MLPLGEETWPRFVFASLCIETADAPHVCPSSRLSIYAAETRKKKKDAVFELADRSECALRFDFKIWLIWFDGEQIPRILKQRLHFHHACYSVPAGWDSSLPADRQESLLQSLPEGSGSTGKLTQGGRMKWCWCVFAFQHERTHTFFKAPRGLRVCTHVLWWLVLLFWAFEGSPFPSRWIQLQASRLR